MRSDKRRKVALELAAGRVADETTVERVLEIAQAYERYLKTGQSE